MFPQMVAQNNEIENTPTKERDCEDHMNCWEKSVVNDRHCWKCETESYTNPEKSIIGARVDDSVEPLVIGSYVDLHDR